MKILYPLTSVLLAIGFVSLAGLAYGQGGNTTSTIEINSDDVLAAMTPAQQINFKASREELRELQENGRQLPAGSAGRKAIASAFAAKKAEFEEKYSAFRGLNGQRITVHGNPPPTKAEIVSIVMNGRLGTGRGGILYPHWQRGDSGVVGSHSSPELEPDKQQTTEPSVSVPAAPSNETGNTNASNSRFCKCKGDDQTDFTGIMCIDTDSYTSEGGFDTYLADRFPWTPQCFREAAY